MLYVYNIYYCTCNTIYFAISPSIWESGLEITDGSDGLVHFFFSFLKRTLALSACSFLKIYSLYIGTVKNIFGGFPSCHYILFWIIWYIWFIFIYDYFQSQSNYPTHTHTYFWVCKFHTNTMQSAAMIAFLVVMTNVIPSCMDLLWIFTIKSTLIKLNFLYFPKKRRGEGSSFCEGSS